MIDEREKISIDIDYVESNIDYHEERVRYLKEKRETLKGRLEDIFERYLIKSGKTLRKENK